MENMDDNVRVKESRGNTYMYIHLIINIVNLLLNTLHMSKSSCKDR